MIEVAGIVKSLTNAQRDARLYGIGHRTVPKAIREMAEKGLVAVFPAAMGWAWRPTDTGHAVRSALAKEEKP